MDLIGVVRSPDYEMGREDGSLTILGHKQLRLLLDDVFAFAPEGTALTVWYSSFTRTTETSAIIARAWERHRFPARFSKTVYYDLQLPNKWPSERIHACMRLAVCAAEWRNTPPKDRHRLLLYVTHEPVPEHFHRAINSAWTKSLDLDVGVGCGYGINLETGAITLFRRANNAAS